MSEPEVKWWGILKREKKSKKIKITRAAKLEAQSPNVFPSFSLSPFPSHLTPHEALAQVTALFNDAICLMPSCACQSISHYPSSRLSHCITRTPWLQHTKEPRLKRRCSGPLGASSRLIGGRCHLKRRGGKQQQATTTKTRGEEDGDDGQIFNPSSSPASPFCWCRRFHKGTNRGWEKKSKTGGIC